MSVNEEVTAGSDSFWEVDQYKRTVRRQDDGFRLCGDLMTLIQERAELEKHYAKSLRAWGKKWTELVDKGPEYATMMGAFKGCLEEAEGMAGVHLQMKDNLLGEVQAQVKQWRGDNYHKGMMGPCKESKQLEDEFRKAQKGWAKKMGKVQKTRKEYHTACKLEKTAIHQENNARGDSGVSPDQLKKIQDKAEKCRKEVETTKDKYEHALRELNDANPKYMEDMTEVFNKSQHFEENRLKFFKEMLFGVHKCLEPSSYAELPNIYSRMYSSIDSADYARDLKWWSQYNGVDMAMNWPTFEEYSPELNTISRKEKKGATTSSDGITMTSIKRSEPAPVAVSATTNHNATPPGSATPTAQRQNNEEKETDEVEESSNQNPFGEDDEWEYDGVSGPVDDGSTGVPVRALYDYEGQEEDELSFKAGDVFVKIKDKDSQGWCTGRKDTKVGLYPENYCEPTQ